MRQIRLGKVRLYVDDEVAEKWRKLDRFTKEEIAILFRALVLSGGKLPVQIDNTKYIVISGRKLRAVKNTIESILTKAESGMLQKPPQWVINDLKKLLEVIG